MKRIFILLVCVLALLKSSSLAAVGCDLNDPDRDVHRFFPASTGYRTEYYSIRKLGGEKLFNRVEKRLGDKFKGLYETIDVPYTIYTILKNKEVIGYIHGVNQKGLYGGIQVFMALDPKGTISDLYFQKMTAQYAGKFRDKSFGAQFRGLKLADFADYDVVSGKTPAGSILKKIVNPVPEAGQDYLAILRGVKKNFILMDEFVFKGRG
jgi:hypothetical protein